MQSTSQSSMRPGSSVHGRPNAESAERRAATSRVHSSSCSACDGRTERPRPHGPGGGGRACVASRARRGTAGSARTRCRAPTASARTACCDRASPSDMRRRGCARVQRAHRPHMACARPHVRHARTGRSHAAAPRSARRAPQATELEAYTCPRCRPSSAVARTTCSCHGIAGDVRR
jgi:hypothetical protein